MYPGDTYDIEVESHPQEQICTLGNGKGTIIDKNIDNIQVHCSTNQFSIGGTIDGLDSGEEATLINNNNESLPVNKNGSFTFKQRVAQGAAYDVTIKSLPRNKTCTVNNGKGEVQKEINSVSVHCSQSSYQVGGTITNLSSDDTIVLTNNNDEKLRITKNGWFEFNRKLAKNATYNVTVNTQPEKKVCLVTNGGGSIDNKNITDIQVICNNKTQWTITPSELTLSVSGYTEYGLTENESTAESGKSRIITIYNTGPETATHIKVVLPTYPKNMSYEDKCSGHLLAADSECRITIKPGKDSWNGSNSCSNGTAPAPSKLIVSADNADTLESTIVVLDYGCLYQGGFVYAFDDTTPETKSVRGKVLTISDQASGFINDGIIWSSNGEGKIPAVVSYDRIPFISNQTANNEYALAATYYTDHYQSNDTTFPTEDQFKKCSGNTDGACNTNNILAFYDAVTTHYQDGNSTPYAPKPGPTKPSLYAASLCKATINGYSDWYLPAICEMGYGGGHVVRLTNQPYKMFRA